MNPLPKLSDYPEDKQQQQAGQGDCVASVTHHVTFIPYWICFEPDRVRDRFGTVRTTRDRRSRAWN